MKKALIALVLAAFAYTGAQAQTKTNCQVVSKKKVASTTAVSTTNTCKLVPNNVCTISPDRRSVICHKSVDPDNMQQYGTQTTYYGPNGAMPGQKARFETQTVVIKDPNKITNYCVRDDEAKATYCYYSGYRICRDANGFYSICPTGVKAENPTTSIKTRKPKNSGNNSVVLK